MAKTIKVEWNAEDVQTIVSEWLGEHISKAQAEKIISKVKAEAEERIARKGFSVIADLVSQRL